MVVIERTSKMKKLIGILFIIFPLFVDAEYVFAARCEYKYPGEDCKLIVHQEENEGISPEIEGTSINCTPVGSVYMFNDFSFYSTIFYDNNGNFKCPTLMATTRVTAGRTNATLLSDGVGATLCPRGCPQVAGELKQDDPPPTPDKPITPPDPYKGVEKCEKGTTDEINYIVACGCIPANVADITSKVYYILRVIGPILLIIVGGVEMAKAVGTQDESAIEKAKKKLVNKAIAAAAIFLVFTLIKLGISIVRDQSQTVELYECLEYLLNGYKI